MRNVTWTRRARHQIASLHVILHRGRVWIVTIKLSWHSRTPDTLRCQLVTVWSSLQASSPSSEVSLLGLANDRTFDRSEVCETNKESMYVGQIATCKYYVRNNESKRLKLSALSFMCAVIILFENTRPARGWPCDSRCISYSRTDFTHINTEVYHEMFISYNMTTAILKSRQATSNYTILQPTTQT